jgi:hypothetical protein
VASVVGAQPARPEAATAASSRPPLEERLYRGAYRRTSSASEFLECGSRQPLEVRGRPEALTRLRDRFRWNAVQMNRPLFAVFRGAVVSDTTRGGRRAAADTMAAPALVNRFLLVWPESLRAWREGDCGLSHPPRW